MFVLVTVAVNTTSWFRVDLVNGRGVTAMAMYLGMRTFQLEPGLLVVIETPDVPAVR